MQLDPSSAPRDPESGPTVSVIIPLFNHEKYIEAALQSVFSQTLRPAEIIVVDDGSGDDSASKVSRLCQDHPEIIFWSWSNQGAHHTLNAAILRATGDFVAIINSDDRYHPERLASCLAIVEADPGIDLVVTRMTFIDDQGNEVASPWYDNALSFFRQAGDFSLGLFNANFLVTTSNLFIRRSVFERIGYFSPLRYTHDLEFCLRFILGNRRLHFIDRPLLGYRVHEKNTISEDKLRGDIERAAVFAFFLYQRWRRNGVNDPWHSSLASYVEVLGEQDILEAVEDFLGLLEGKPGQDGVAISGSLPTDFLEFLSRLGVDWVHRGIDDPLLAQYVAARKALLSSSNGTRSHSNLVARMKADKKWLVEQRDAWEAEARAQEELRKSLMKALDDQAKSWAQALEDQSDSWARALENQAKSWTQELEDQRKYWTQAMDGMRVGNAWLMEQRENWEKAASAHEERATALTQAMEEMRIGKEWLDEQRKAWEAVATDSGEELARCHAALNRLQGKRLFRLLVRAKLLELTDFPPRPVAPG